MEKIDRLRHGQFFCSGINGDCFRASLSVILDVPNDVHMPNDHSDRWWFVWQEFFGEFGMSLHYDDARGRIWKQGRWVASVPSKNLEGRSHAIVMEDTKVLFDPSPKRRYRAGTNMLGSDLVNGGYWLEVADATKLENYVAWHREWA